MHVAVRSFLVVLVCCFCSNLVQAVDKADDSPSPTPNVEVLKEYAAIDIQEREYEFAEILEGEQISHDFVVKNKGTAPLEIKKVQLGCECMSSNQDLTVPPGGQGKLTVKIDSNGYGGGFHRFLTVFTNDPIQPRLRLTMKGKIKPLIEVLPGNLIALSGVVGEVPEGSLDLKATDKPFHITGMQTDLEGKIRHEIETVEDGRHYRLKVKNTAPAGSYRGGIKLQTDLAAKNQIVVQVKGEIKGLVSIMPSAVSIGKMSKEAEPRIGKIVVKKNVNQAFNITKLTYDEKLMTVAKEALPDASGYQLTITPIMENIPPQGEGKQDRLERKLSILTDLNSEPYEAKVELVNRR